jgi:hypothetical protein
MIDPVDPARVPRPLSGPLEAARERTEAAIRSSFERGEMTFEELDERLELCQTATRQAELEVLVKDLGTRELAKAPVAVPAGASAAPERLTAVLGVQLRGGSWVVPQALHVWALLGVVNLDLREATFAPGVTEITANAWLGAITIIVPPGLRVEAKGLPLGGSFPQHNLGAPTSRGPTVRVRGNAVIGTVGVVVKKKQG